MSITFMCDKHEVNMSNSNAGAFLNAMGLVADYCGEIEIGQLELAANNLKRSKMDLLKPTIRHGNVISCGRDQMYVDRRSQEMLDLIEYAQLNRKAIQWG